MKNNIPTLLIDTDEDLTNLVAHLKTLKEISIDTEFDRFRYQYGIHLQLIQIFDGATCYLVDSLKIKNLSGLWTVFEDENICKIIYSGSEDIDILKKMGCVTRNLFDIQIAAALCNREETSYSKLVAAEFGVEIDKKLQTSRWNTRPLSPSQLEYASNDVIFLPELKSILLKEIKDEQLLLILKEENSSLELSSTEAYAPKLSGKQKKEFNRYAQQKLLEMKQLLDTYAQQLNVPPYFIVPDFILEDILRNKQQFLEFPFAKNFHREVLSDEQFKNKVLDIIHCIDEEKVNEVPSRERIEKDETSPNHARKVNLADTVFPKFKQFVIAKYGEVSSVVLLRGISKMFSLEVVDWDGAKQFQKDLYVEFLAKP